MIQNGKCGTLSYTPEEARDRSFLEYWLHAVPLTVFLDFLDRTSPAVLSHSLCDVRFATFIRDHAGIPTSIYLPPMPHLFWMYFHRQHEGQVIRDLQSAAKVATEDSMAAKQLL